MYGTSICREGGVSALKVPIALMMHLRMYLVLHCDAEQCTVPYFSELWSVSVYYLLEKGGVAPLTARHELERLISFLFLPCLHHYRHHNQQGHHHHHPSPPSVTIITIIIINIQIGKAFGFFLFNRFPAKIEQRSKILKLTQTYFLGMAMRQFLAMRYHGDIKRLVSLWAASNSKKIPNFHPFRVIPTLILQFPKGIDQRPYIW